MEEINQNVPIQYVFSINDDQYLINLDNIGEEQFEDLAIESMEMKNGKLSSVGFYIDKFNFHINDEQLTYIAQYNIPLYRYLIGINQQPIFTGFF